jgi:hypothetical protein
MLSESDIHFDAQQISDMLRVQISTFDDIHNRRRNCGLYGTSYEEQAWSDREHSGII